jgi:hypothetical protein
MNVQRHFTRGAAVSSSNPSPDAEATLKNLRELNETFLEAAKRSDAVYLDSYEKTMRALTEFQSAAANATDDSRMRALANAYADFTREVTTAYVTAARELRK